MSNYFIYLSKKSYDNLVKLGAPIVKQNGHYYLYGFKLVLRSMKDEN